MLLTKLTIPGVFEGKTDEFRIARYARFDSDGMPQLPPSRIFGNRGYADGGNEKGGFGFGGGIDINEDEEHEDVVVLTVNYYWTTPDQVKGYLNEEVSAKIGAPLDVKLPGGCRLQVSWRSARPS